MIAAAEMSGPNRVSVDAYVRPTLMLEPVDSKLRTLTRLQRDGVVSSVSIHSLPEKVNLNANSEYTEITEMYDRIERWAKTHSVDLAPAFSLSSITSEIWEGTRRIVRMPMMVILIKFDSQLVGAFPYSTDQAHHSVEEVLTVIISGGLERILPESVTFPPAPGDECPECGGILVNTQGVLSCYDCLWDELTQKRRRASDFDIPESEISI